MTRKTRTELEYDSSGIYQLIDNSTGAILTGNTQPCRFTSFQRTDSSGHPWKWSAKKKRENLAQSEDLGGPFETRLTLTSDGRVLAEVRRPNVRLLEQSFRFGN